ncbi:MAG: hypothetical protein ACLPLR_14440 [Terriglobales bacterium]
MKPGTLLLIAGSLLLAGPLAAQESAEPSRGPDAGTQFRVHGIQVLPAVGRPFSGRDSIEWTRNLEDGSVTTTHLYATVARDSQGRIYREHRSFVSANSSQESKYRDMVFLDPVAHTRTTCTFKTRRCAITSYHESATFIPIPAGPIANGTAYLTRESLGPSVVEGINVVGTRETITINPGIVGNDKPLVTTREFWYSPDLQVNLSVTRKDPRLGTQVLQLVELSLSEPDPAQFRVPASFVIQDLRVSARARKAVLGH